MTDAGGSITLAQAASAELRRLDRKGVRRIPRTQVRGDLCRDFSTNDYLAFREDPVFQKAMLEAASAQPSGAGGSRMLGGDHAVHVEAEQAFASFKGTETAVLFPTGYQANVGLIQALATKTVAFFADRFCHASVVDGLRVAPIPKSRRTYFTHCDYEHLESLLCASKAEHNIILTESRFSMDGDTADLRHLLALAKRYRGTLVVDEAHAIGVEGPEGRGLAADLIDDSIITVDTCGKAFGIGGAFVGGPAWVRDLILNRGRAYIYTTGISPWLAAGLIAAIPFVRASEQERSHLRAMAEYLHRELTKLGWRAGNKPSHITPLHVGQEERAMEIEHRLMAEKFAVRAIRPPTVPPGTSRLRLSLNAAMDPETIDQFISALGPGHAQ